MTQTGIKFRSVIAMPPSSATTTDKVLEYTSTVAKVLQDVASQIPFVNRVCGLTLTILPMVQVWYLDRNSNLKLIGIQNTRFQKDRCLRIVEDIHHVLCILMNLCNHSEDIESVEMLSLIAQFTV